MKRWNQMNKTVHLFTSLDSEAVKEYFLSKRHDFFIESSSKSIKFTDLEDKESYIVSDKRIGFKLMLLITETKNNIKKNVERREISPVMPQYTLCNKNNFLKMQDEILQVIEIDLIKAYLESAYKQGFIDEIVYKKLLLVSGESRKIAIGAIASKKTINYYNKEGEIVKNEIKTDEKLRRVWMQICAGTDSVMREIINMNAYERFLFYWVDNIFFKMESWEQVENKNFEQSLKSINMPSGIPFREFVHHSLIYTMIRSNLLEIEISDGRTFTIRV
jgi:hypothetical protein